MDIINPVSLISFAEKTFLPAQKIQSIQALISIDCKDTQMDHQTPVTNTSLVLAIDTSGSMFGDKLNAIKLAIDYLLDAVDTTCAISIIQFSDVVRLLTPEPIKTSQDGVVQLRDMIHHIQPGGNTNLTSAILTTMQHTLAFQTPNVQIMLFTDGIHNVGELSWKELYSTINLGLIAQPIPINTFSIGSEPDASQLMLLSNMSAGGCYVHMETSDDVPRVFGARVGALRAQQFTKCCLELEAFPGIRIIMICGIECAKQELIQCKKYRFSLGNIYAGCKKFFLCTLSLRNLTPDEEISIGPHQPLLHINLTSADMQPLSSQINISRANSETLPISEDQNLRLAYAQVYSTVKFSIGAAIVAAENSRFYEAQSIIENAINHLRQTRINDSIEPFVEDLLGLKKSFTNGIIFRERRNATYSKLSSHAHQQGGTYTTEREESAANDIVKKRYYLNHPSPK